MRPILSDILSLFQHLFTLANTPQQYRPEQCPHCCKRGLWGHGVYYRQAQCENQGQPVPVPRFLCPGCGHTCSTLPEYIPLRRWYYWISQQMALMLLMLGKSLQTVADELSDSLPVVPGITTLHRWWGWMTERFLVHQCHVCHVHPGLRHAPTREHFWRMYFDEEGPLSGAMLILNRAGHIVP